MKKIIIIVLIIVITIVNIPEQNVNADDKQYLTLEQIFDTMNWTASSYEHINNETYINKYPYYIVIRTRIEKGGGDTIRIYKFSEQMKLYRNNSKDLKLYFYNTSNEKNTDKVICMYKSVAENGYVANQPFNIESGKYTEINNDYGCTKINIIYANYELQVTDCFNNVRQEDVPELIALENSLNIIVTPTPPESTPLPTVTSIPPTPTNTPIPTPTDTPIPTPTNTPIPIPTNTPMPTSTPTPFPDRPEEPLPTDIPTYNEGEYDENGEWQGLTEFEAENLNLQNKIIAKLDKLIEKNTEIIALILIIVCFEILKIVKSWIKKGGLR